MTPDLPVDMFSLMDVSNLYEQVTEALGKPLFSFTVADFFKAPAVDEVGLSSYIEATGELIIVLSHDDFKVTRLRVSISNADGLSIENGETIETPAKANAEYTF